MPLAVELELDAVVDDPLALQPVADAGLDEEVGDRLLEHAGADPVLDVVAAPVLEHDRLDALAVEELGEREPRRPGADDRRPACASARRLGSTSSSTRLRDRERAVRRRHAAVDRAVQEDLLDLVRREADRAARRGRASRAPPRARARRAR